MAAFCRSCCGNFWGSSSSELHTHRTSSKTSASPKSASSVSTASWKGEDVGAIDSPTQLDFQPHAEADAELLAKKWITHVQRRAVKVWERNQVLEMLRTVAMSVSYTDDPIIGDPSPSAPCVQWHGDVSMEQGLPVIQVHRSKEDKTVPSYVSKLLSFLFADDESLKLLRQVGAGSGSMNCGNSQCVRLSHFVGYTQKWAAKYQPSGKSPTKSAAADAKTQPKKAAAAGKVNQ